ncbi:MAG: hypothetical protein ABW252_23475 [Polyangiales bacterium]
MRADRVWAMLMLLAACTRTHELASSGDDGAIPDDASTADDAGASEAGADAGRDAGPAFSFDAGVVFCGARPCACSNGRDDDGDGLRDGFDPECTGAFDDFEQDFATGAPDEDRTSKCQDCFFDVVPGRDACNRATSCTLDGTPSGGTGACRTCAVASACGDYCARLAPNGCDCFGCCEVQRPSGTVAILLQSGCSMATLDDPQRCTRCVPARDCQNACDPCEPCPGRTLADLSPSCGGQFGCVGSAPCQASSDCGGLSYCQAGCCLDVVI